MPRPPRTPRPKYETGKAVLVAMDQLSKDPDGFLARITEHIAWMDDRYYAHSTMGRCERTLVHFAIWCEKRGVERPAQVTRPLLERYARHLREDEKGLGAGTSVHYQYDQISTLRVFFRQLARRNHILYSPANDLELPKLGFRLPRGVLTHAEMERVLSQPDIRTPSGVRDRAILETFYSTGVRRAELTRLLVSDLDLARGTATVRQGKGQKDRVVPIGERAQDWIERYLADVRPGFVTDPNQQTLYVTAYGQPLSTGALSHRVTEYVKAAEVGKDGSCHVFRHTMATQMLERGADIRVIQEILGHVKLETTSLYTRVSIAHLKEVHDRTHPSAKRGPLDEGTPEEHHPAASTDDKEPPTPESLTSRNSSTSSAPEDARGDGKLDEP